MTVNQKIIGILKFSTLEDWRFQFQELTEKFMLIICHYRPSSQTIRGAIVAACYISETGGVGAEITGGA